MLPLRATTGVARFPWSAAALISVFVMLQIGVWIQPGTASEQLLAWVKRPIDMPLETLSDWQAFGISLLVFGNVFALWITSLYVWSFVPSLAERTSFVWTLLASLGITLATYWIYRSYHGPQAVAPLILSQVWVSAMLGLAMRHEIWDTVSTFVFGPKIFQIYEVPSYVLLFFWFFYIMVGNLFLEAPFSDAPTVYFLPLVAFILGFLVESLHVAVCKKTAPVSTAP